MGGALHNMAMLVPPLRPFDTWMRSSPDVSAVVAASEALNVREFNLFRVAYAWWFGRNGSDKEVERPFMNYLFTEQAPLWVRQFAREVLDRKREGRLDPKQYGLPPLPQAPSLPGVQSFLRGVWFSLWVMAIGILLIGIFS